MKNFLVSVITILCFSFAVNVLGESTNQNNTGTSVNLNLEESPLAYTILLAQKSENQIILMAAAARLALDCAEKGQFDVAFKLLQGVDYPYTKIQTLTKIAGIYARNGDKNKAKETISRALKVAETLVDSSDIDKAQLSAEIAKSYIKLGEKEETTKILNTVTLLLKDKDYLLDGINNIGEIYADAGNYEQAGKIAEKLTGIDKKVSLLVYMATNSEEKEAALVLLSQATSLAKAAKGQENPLLGKIACGYAKLKQFDTAASLIKEIGGNNDIDQLTENFVLINLAEIYMQDGQNQKAKKILSGVLQVIKLEELSIYKAPLLKEAIDVSFIIGDKDLFSSIVSESLGNIKTLSDEYNHLKLSLLGKIGKYYTLNGEEEKATDMFVQALNIIKNNKSLFNQIDNLYNLSQYYVEAKRKISEKERIIFQEIIKNAEPKRKGEG